MSGELVIGGRSWSLEVGTDFGELPEEIREAVDAWFDVGRTVMELRTSGSTGAPKRIEISKEAMRESVRRTGAVLGLGEGTRALWVLPAGFVGGFMMLVRAVELGWTLIYDGPPRARVEVPAGGVDFCACTPMQLAASGGLPGVGTLLLGGSPVMPGLNFEGVGRVFESFGMTETVSHIAVRRLWPEAAAWFQCVPGVEVERDEAGCLVVSAPHLFEEPLVTRDLVEVEGRTKFRWVGRADDVINSGGVKVHPVEVERALAGIVTEPFVVAGRPHEVLGSEVVLVVNGERPVKAEALEARWLREAAKILQKFDVPRAVVWRNLDQTQSGKWKRPTL